uniref:Uncharacterized protein n=1 Tax=Glossina pallidipes TaxID=7398 RepID=A0A1A9ZTC3_GLOPL
MLHLVQSGKSRSVKISVPEGLPELLSDITQEVIRCQPSTECMCEFIIDYLRSVIAAREKLRVANMIIDRALRKVDEIMADLCICDIAKEKSEQMTVVMEKCFKRFLAKRRCEKDKPNEILKFVELDILDELIQKCRFTDLELKKTRTFIEAAYGRFVDMYLKAQKDVDPTETLYQYLEERELQRLSERHSNEAAIKIQAFFRGYMVRKTLHELKQAKLWWQPNLEVPCSDERIEILHDVEKRKIQRTYYVDDECKCSSNVSMTARSPEQFKRQATRKHSVTTWAYPDSVVEEEGFVKRIYKIPPGTMMDAFGKSEDREVFESHDIYNAAIEDDCDLN